MKELFEYIFYKAFRFDAFISGDDDKKAHFYGVIIVSLFISLKLYLFLSVLFYLMWPENLWVIDDYFKYLLTLILVIVSLYVKHKQRYLQIINKCEKFPKKKKRLYWILSTLYLIILIVLNLWIDEYIRDYNTDRSHIFALI